MNEIFDKLLIKIAFSIFICLILYVFKYAHVIFYPIAKKQLFKKFYATENPGNTIHLFSRIIGIGIIFSGLAFNIKDQLLIVFLDFLIQGCLSFLLFLLGIFILENISLYNFEFVDEVFKRRNLSYSVIVFSQTISLSFIIRSIQMISQGSLLILIFLWLLTMVLIGFSSKGYSMYSKHSFNKLLYQKNLSLAFSYSGYLFGCTFLIISALKQELTTIQTYGLHVILKIILSIIIFPLFKMAIKFIFKLTEARPASENGIRETKADKDEQNLGFGIYEGSLFFTTSLLTSIIVSKVKLGIVYPIF